MPLPTITLDTFHSLSGNRMTSETIGPMFERLLEEQPLIWEYLASAAKTNQEAALVGLVVYRLLRSATDAKDLEALIG